MGPEATVVVESRDIIFFEAVLLPPTLNGLRQPQEDVDKPVIRPVPDHTNELPTPHTTTARNIR